MQRECKLQPAPPPHHNHFTALFPGPPGWAAARRELLDFMVQGKINRGRHADHPAGRHSIWTNQCPHPPSPISSHTASSLTKCQGTTQCNVPLGLLYHQLASTWHNQLTYQFAASAFPKECARERIPKLRNMGGYGSHSFWNMAKCWSKIVIFPPAHVHLAPLSEFH